MQSVGGRRHAARQDTRYKPYKPSKHEGVPLRVPGVRNEQAGILYWISRVHLQLILPAPRASTEYAVPPAPNDLPAIKAIKKHYERIRDDAAPAYAWEEGEWRSKRREA